MECIWYWVWWITLKIMGEESNTYSGQGSEVSIWTTMMTFIQTLSSKDITEIMSRYQSTISVSSILCFHELLNRLFSSDHTHIRVFWSRESWWSYDIIACMLEKKNVGDKWVYLWAETRELRLFLMKNISTRPQKILYYYMRKMGRNSLSLRLYNFFCNNILRTTVYWQQNKMVN